MVGGGSLEACGADLLGVGFFCDGLGCLLAINEASPFVVVACCGCVKEKYFDVLSDDFGVFEDGWDCEVRLGLCCGVLAVFTVDTVRCNGIDCLEACGGVLLVLDGVTIVFERCNDEGVLLVCAGA